MAMTRDNMITNKLVRQGKLPKSQMEIYPQRKPKINSSESTNREDMGGSAKYAAGSKAPMPTKAKMISMKKAKMAKRK